MSDYEYEITYTVLRTSDEGYSIEDIGFGASGLWGTPEECVHMVMSDIQNYYWETEGHMPDPEDIRAEIENR